MKITPLGERVLIQQISQTEERTKSGLYIPKSNEEKKEGIVVSVGTLNNSQPIPLKQGDKVIYGGYSSEEIELEGKKHLIVELKDIVAKIE